MAPKRKLEVPTVSDEELEKAKTTLKDADEAKRARAPMTRWLESQGKKRIYDSWPIGSRREFFQNWFAEKLSKGGTSKSTKTNTLFKKNNARAAWWSPQKMINEFGEQKAKEKAEGPDKGPAKWRPDRDAGKYGPWSREYRIILDMRDEGDEEKDSNEVNAEEALDSEEKQKEANEALAAMRSCNAGSSSASGQAALTKVKEEPKDEPEAKLEAKPEESPTFQALQNDGKKVAFNIGKALTTAKQMFIDTKNVKFVGELHQEIASNVQMMTMVFQAVEDGVLKNAEKPTPLALSVKVDEAFEALNENVKWFNKFFPKESQQRKLNQV